MGEVVTTVINLLDNALRFSPDGGTIRVSLRQRAGWCRVSIRDEGPGLSEEDQERLFFGQRGPLTERGLDQLVAKYAYQARLEHCTAHTLRHSFAKNLVDAGTPLDQVATLFTSSRRCRRRKRAAPGSPFASHHALICR